MKSPYLLVAALAALPLALGACGYHRIGTPSTPLREEAASKPTPVKVAPRQDDARAAAAYFPLTAGTTFTYARSYADKGPAGTRVMSVVSADGAEAWVNNRIEVGGEMVALQFSGRVATHASRMTVAVPGFGNVHTMQSFALKSPLKSGLAWDAEIDGRAWSFASRKSETVAVPAGVYDCLVVEGLTRSTSLGARQHVKQTLYLAPSVGLVKMVLTVDEQREHEVVNQSLTEELVSVQ